MIRHTCSNCLYWGDYKVETDGGLIAANCEKSFEAVKGSDTCGQWKKVKYYYNEICDRRDKDYSKQCLTLKFKRVWCEYRIANGE